MDKVKRSMRDIIGFLNVAHIWQHQKQGEGQSHLKFAIAQVMPGCEEANRAHEAKKGRINIECCTVDEKGNVLLDGHGGLIFTREATNKRTDQTEKLLDETVEVEVYFAKVVPPDLTPAQERAFAGFVIPAMVEPPMPEPKKE